MNAKQMHKERMRIAKGEGVNEFTVIDNLTGQQLREMLDAGVADPEDRQNDAPTFLEITEFLEKNPSFRASGYIITPPRSDHRISLDTVYRTGGVKLSTEEVCSFIEFVHQPDELSITPTACRAWWD